MSNSESSTQNLPPNPHEHHEILPGENLAANKLGIAGVVWLAERLRG